MAITITTTFIAPILLRIVFDFDEYLGQVAPELAVAGESVDES